MLKRSIGVIHYRNASARYFLDFLHFDTVTMGCSSLLATIRYRHICVPSTGARRADWMVVWPTQMVPVCVGTRFFGDRRNLEILRWNGSSFTAGDGNALLMHHQRRYARPVVLTPGTAMTGLSYCIDTVPRASSGGCKGFDVWLVDWRTSPRSRARAALHAR
jgi:hypothetical protein